MGDRRGLHTPPRIFDRFLRHNPLAVTGSLWTAVTVAAVARVVSVAAVAAGEWASGAGVLGPSFGVTSLQGFAVIRDPSLIHPYLRRT